MGEMRRQNTTGAARRPGRARANVTLDVMDRYSLAMSVFNQCILCGRKKTLDDVNLSDELDRDFAIDA